MRMGSQRALARTRAPLDPVPRAVPIVGILLVTMMAVSACSDRAPASASTQQGGPNAGAAIAEPAGTAFPQPGADAPGDWTLPGRDYAATRYSPLDQITPGNVGNLKLAWTFSTGMVRGFEGQPLVVNNTMYVVTPWPNWVFAIDLRNPTGPLRWSYHPPTSPAAEGVACCDVVNRGASYADGKIVFNRLDNHTVALDAATGKVVWDTQLDEIARGSTMTMAPLVVKNRVYVGNSGGELGVHGWVAALDLGSGKVVWRAYNTGPDSLVKIGPRFKPFYRSMQGQNLGETSWPPGQWKIGGSAVWGWITYDPDANLIYYGTSNPGVWNPDLRPGDNKWGSTIFARDPETGDAVWAYQVTPHDEWDYDAVNESVVADLTINGQPRKALVHFDRNGFVYTIDRKSGEVLVAQPFQYANWARGIDLKTGLPQRNPDKATHQGQTTREICPSSTGARDQQPAAYSPRTHLFYSPATNLCMNYGGSAASYIAGTPYLGAEVQMYAGPGGRGARGEFLAWDATTGRKVWGITERFPVWSGPVVTASDLGFYGTMDGWFRAVDLRNGKVVWQTKLGSGVVGNPIAYQGPDGKEYIAVYSGIGGWLGAVALGLDTTDPTGALGAIGAMPDLPNYTAPGGMVYVFALP